MYIRLIHSRSVFSLIRMYNQHLAPRIDGHYYGPAVIFPSFSFKNLNSRFILIFVKMMN